MVGIAGFLTGIGGSVVSNIFNIFSQKQKNKQELAVGDLRIRELQAEHAANIQQIRIEGDIQKELASAKIFEASQKYGNGVAAPSKLIEKLFDSKWTAWAGAILVMLLGLMDVLRTSVRPVVTYMCIGITGYITLQYMDVMSISEIDGGLIDKAQIMLILDSVIYLTFTVVGWWFGDRRMAKYAYRLNDGNKQDK